MGDNDSPACDLRSDTREHRCDVLVGQTMEAVSLNPGMADFAGQWNHFCYRRLSPMETGIETCNLRNAGKSLRDGFDRRNIVRLMQRGQRRKPAEFGQDLRRY